MKTIPRNPLRGRGNKLLLLDYLFININALVLLAICTPHSMKLDCIQMLHTVEPSSRTVDTPQADAPVPDQPVMRHLPSRASKRVIVRPPMMNERVRRFQPEVTAYTRSDERVYVSQDAIVPESSTTCSSSRTSSGYTCGVGYRGSAGYRGSVGFTSKYGGSRQN